MWQPQETDKQVKNIIAASSQPQTLLTSSICSPPAATITPRPVEHKLQCIPQASTSQATEQAMGSRMADCLRLRGKFAILAIVGIWKYSFFDFVMDSQIAVYALICCQSLFYTIYGS